jgi:hypothetical protein
MSEPRKTVYARDVQQGHAVIAGLWEWAKPLLSSGHQLCIKAMPMTRSLEQNAAQWPILDAFSRQLQWPVNGKMVHMTPEEWKDTLSAAFQNETVRLAMGLNGGVVMLGMRTSKMSKARFSEWLEFLHAVAAERGVTVYPDERPTNDATDH